MSVPVMVDTPDGLMGAMKPGGESCPHLSFEGVTARCAVHDRPEYEGSPCWTYGNSDVDPDFIVKRGRPCQVGLAVLGRGGLCEVHPEARQTTLALQTLGPWPEE